MSRIYFHGGNGRYVMVSGAERTYLRNMCVDLFLASLNVDRLVVFGHVPLENNDRLTAFCDLLGQDNYLVGEVKKQSGFRIESELLFWNAVKTYFSLGGRNLLGGMIELFDLQINTAHLIGSDEIKLAARIHSQCEFHGYVEGENRAWLANIIENALTTGIFRRDARGYDGWEGVITLLRSADNSPIVMSYSGYHSFPNPHIAMWDPPGDTPYEGEDWLYDAWNQFSTAEQWKRAVAGIRATNGLELKPENWNQFYAGIGIDAFMLRQLLELGAEAARQGTSPYQAMLRAVCEYGESQNERHEAWAWGLSQGKALIDQSATLRQALV